MQRGFTLIELMVSVAIFVTVMTISLGALLSISAADRKAETLKSVMNNLNFALDSMARSIRTGTNYHCGTSGTLEDPLDCASTPNNSITFLSVNGDLVTYSLELDSGQCGTGAIGGCVKRRTVENGGAGASSGFLQVTAPEVDIQTLDFYVLGSVSETDGDPTHSQPKTTITITGTVPVTPTQNTNFNLQTSVTQRLYDQ